MLIRRNDRKSMRFNKIRSYPNWIWEDFSSPTQTKEAAKKKIEQTWILYSLPLLSCTLVDCSFLSMNFHIFFHFYIHSKRRTGWAIFWVCRWSVYLKSSREKKPGSWQLSLDVLPFPHPPSQSFFRLLWCNLFLLSHSLFHRKCEWMKNLSEYFWHANGIVKRRRLFFSSWMVENKSEYKKWHMFRTEQCVILILFFHFFFVTFISFF